MAKDVSQTLGVRNTMTVVSPEVDLFSLVYLLGAAQGLFLVLALSTVKKGSVRANAFLAVFTLTFSITLVDIFLEYTRYYVRVPWLLGTIWPTNFIYGPLLLYYTYALLNRPGVISVKKMFWHFLPFISSWIVLIPWFTLPSEVKVTAFFADLTQLVETLPEAIKIHLALAVLGHGLTVVATIVHIGSYLLIVMKNLQQHHKRIKEQFSYTDKISLNWLRNIAFIGLILWLLLIFSEWFAQYFQVAEQAYFGMHVLIAFFIYSMGYLGLKQPIIFKAQTLSDPVAAGQAATKVKLKYEKSSLDKESAAQLALLVQEKMRRDRLYLDNQLSLAGLASTIDTSPHYLSQVINDNLGKNFFDFVNEYRIEEAKYRIQNAREGRINVLAIALDSGFSSKSAFYTAFKRYTGMTPSEYKASTAANRSSTQSIH